MATYTGSTWQDPWAGFPPPPQMFGAELFCGDDTYSYMRGPLPKALGGTPLYTAEQLRAYALAERERWTGVVAHAVRELEELDDETAQAQAEALRNLL